MIATAPALLIGLGARILLDHLSRSEGPFIKDFILAGAWQGVALHYATKTSKTSGFGIVVAFGVAAKLFIEFNLGSDITRCITTILGVALGVLFTDFLSQYFDKPARLSDRRRKPIQSTQPSRKPRIVQFHPSVQGGSVETLPDITDIATSLATTQLFSDITSVDSHSDKIGPTSSMSSLEREIHVLRTRASLADSERRRLKEERKWAISQGNIARASQMKWEVKRYTTLMQDFTREADLKALEGALEQTTQGLTTDLSGVAVSNMNVNGNNHRRREPCDPKLVPSSSKDKVPRSTRDIALTGLATPTSGYVSQKVTQQPRRSSNSKLTTREANG